MKQNKTINSIVGILIVLAIGGYHYFSHVNNSSTPSTPSSSQIKRQPKDSTSSSQSPSINDEDKPYDRTLYNQLAGYDFESGGSPVIEINNGQSTLDMNNWQTNKVIYGDLDQLNRTTYVTAYIDKKNLGRSEGRERQVWKPTGWHQKKMNHKEIYNRGHLLAYTSSFNFDMDGNYKEGELGSIDNPKNLATQSAFSNQKVQTHYETMVRNAQKISGNKVVYQIVTVFRGNELMPRGYWLQAKDSNGTLNLNVYEYNVQPKIQFNYQDGTSKIDQQMSVSFNY